MKRININESQYKVLLSEIIDGNSPDQLVYDGERYVAMQDASFPILYHNGKWISKGETHRDIISLIKYGCEEWELENYFDYDKRQRIIQNLDRLWSDNDEFSYLSRVFYAKENAKKNGIDYILISWDKLNYDQIDDICKTFNMQINKVAYLENDL